MDDSAARTLWCGNLAWEVEDELLYDLFLQAGPLEKVSIPKERDGRCRGYGFVTFKHECSVPYAMKLMRGTTLFGKLINLQNRSGAKAETVPNDLRNPYHQRSMSYQEHGSLSGGSDPYLSQAESLGNLLSMAAGFLGHYPDRNRQSGNQNHQRSRSYNTGSRYHDGNYRDERRGHYGNRNDRHQSRDNDYHGRARNNDYHEGFRSSHFRNRDRDRNRSNNRSNNNRYR